jgi:uncharacterized heparinase superfamily protein
VLSRKELPLIVDSLGLWARTIRHLRPSQLINRVRYSLRRPLWERRSRQIDARYEARALRRHSARWSHPGIARVALFRAGLESEARAREVAEAALEGRFCFLGNERELGRDVDWFRSDLDVGTRLWKTHLHEFAYAEALARTARDSGDPRYRERLFELARSWRSAAPIGCRDFAMDAWNGRATANRLIHWAVAGSVLGLEDGDPDAHWLGQQVAVAGLFLRDNLELDLLGNHLFRDSVGLVFAHELTGVVPDALSWLEAQVHDQVLPDGAHVERAPMYHAICLRDLSEVRLLLGDRAPDWLCDAELRMAGFLESILLGDGEISLLGDGWLGQTDCDAVLGAVRAVGTPVRPQDAEQHSGIACLRRGDLRLVARVGPHGPDYLLGHAHADLLSFDLSTGTRRVVTDSGTHLYDPGPERHALRSTRAHNTLQIDGEEQLEAWGSFRVGRRGRARCHARSETGNWRWISASHEAFSFLPGRPIHHRLLALAEGQLLVLDCVLGQGSHRLESFLNLHPDGDDRRMAIHALGETAREEEGALHEHFGESRLMRRLVVDVRRELPWCGGWWLAHDPDPRHPVPAPALREGRIEVALPAPLGILSWQPGARDSADALRIDP